MADYWANPASSSRGAILVLHAWWGLNQFFKDLCDKLADEGYLCLAPDLYDGAVAATIPEAEKLRKKVKRSAISSKILDSLNLLQKKARGKSIGLIGFSLGAYWSLWLVAEKPKAITSTVLFYGTRSGDYSSVRSTFLGHFAESDEFESNTARDKLEKSLRKTGKTVEFHTYPNTSHWFFESDRPEFKKQVSEIAWQRTIAFLNTNLAGRK